jgi:predicted metalloprotease with PDZ domain
MTSRFTALAPLPVLLTCRNTRLLGFSFLILFWPWLIVFGSGHTARAESPLVQIRVLGLSPARVRVEADLSVAGRIFSFRNAYAGVVGLGQRIQNVSLVDAGGGAILIRNTASGEFEAQRPGTHISYEVTLDPPVFAADSAHVSWLTADRGFVMLGDLLPRQATVKSTGGPPAINVRVDVPGGWSVAANEEPKGSALFELQDPLNAVFFLGKHLRASRIEVGRMQLTFLTEGDWAFTDASAANLAADILKEYSALMGGPPRAAAIVMLAPFPSPVAAERWSAETRGGTVVFLAGRYPSRTAALAQLSTPLTHELFHLWVPNALALDGDYDWFYEGFTLYEALRAAMRLGVLTFQDYLDTMGRAFDLYRSAKDADQLSLIDASKRRWTGNSVVIYNKALLVAFLYDLTLRRQTRNSHSVEDVYRELFQRYGRADERRDGNLAVLDALNSVGEMREFNRRFIETAAPIDLSALITPFGLSGERPGARTHVSLIQPLSHEQRDLLRAFGYNSEAHAKGQSARPAAHVSRKP